MAPLRCILAALALALGVANLAFHVEDARDGLAVVLSAASKGEREHVERLRAWAKGRCVMAD